LAAAAAAAAAATTAAPLFTAPGVLLPLGVLAPP